MQLMFETLLAVGQKAANHALQFDVATQTALASLDAKVIALHLPQLEESIYVTISDQQVFFSRQHGGPVDLSLRADVKALWYLAQSNAPAQNVDISGDVHLAQKVSELVQNFEPDWEEAICQVAGDILGYRLAQVIRDVHAWFKQLMQNIMENTADYWVDESPMIAAKSQVGMFVSDVDELRDDVERLQARVAAKANESITGV